jgi:hypothetical protein
MSVTMIMILFGIVLGVAYFAKRNSRKRHEMKTKRGRV